MKKVIILILCLSVSFSCKNDKKTSEQTTEQESDLTLLKGEFVYFADAAVFKTDTEVYGVVIDEKMHELDKEVQKHKKEYTDMVPVEIRGKLIPKPENEEGWPFQVQIIEIIKISQPNPENNNTIELGN